MNLRQLEYFVAVSETLNFTQAAKRCFISQTAMSLQIKALEEKVGVPLLIRDKHHVSLTPAGRVYLNEARMILERVNEAAKLAQTAAEGISGTITIGFIRGYEQSLFSETLRSFHAAYPNISIELVRDNMGNLYSMLEGGECDAVFNLAPYLRTYPNLNFYFLKAYQMMAVFYPGHPLAARESLTYSDLMDEDFIIMQPKGQTSEEVDEVALCRDRGGFFPHIIHREKEIQTLLLMISAGMGIAVLPEYCVRYYAQTKNLRIVRLVTEEDVPETVNFGLSWKKNHTNPAVSQLLNWMKFRKAEE